MKILYLCPDLGIPVLGRKGASVHVREMIGAFARAGHQVVLAAQTLNKSPWEAPATLDVPVLQIRPGQASTTAVQGLKDFNQLLALENSLPGELRRILYNKDLAQDLARRFENDPPDFIYERASLYATAGATLARELGAPLLLEVNAPLAVEQTAYRSTGFGDLADKAERWTLNAADVVLPVSKPLREHVLSLGVLSERIHVVPNGVNTSLFSPGEPDQQVRARYAVNGGLVLGFVGGLRPWHGVEALPSLMTRLSKRFADLQMIIVGDGQLRANLQREFKQLGLAEKVTFTGALPHDEVAGVVRLFDLAVAPYPKPDHDFYFSPLKLFEYMACGVPVVAANLGQIAEVVVHGQTGLLYPAGDLEALALQCEQALSDPSLRKSVGSAAAGVIQRDFTWERNAQRVVEIAQQLLKRSKTT